MSTFAMRPGQTIPQARSQARNSAAYNYGAAPRQSPSSNRPTGKPSQPYGAYNQQPSFRPGRAQSQQSPYAYSTPYGQPSQQPSVQAPSGAIQNLGGGQNDPRWSHNGGAWASPFPQQGLQLFNQDKAAPRQEFVPTATGPGGTYEMIQEAPGRWSAPTAAFLRNGGNASPYTPSDPDELARIKNMNANNPASSYMTDSNRRTYEARIANMNTNNPASKNDQKPASQAGYLAGRTFTRADMTALKAIASESGVSERDLMSLSQEEFKRIKDQATRSFMQRVDSKRRRGSLRDPQDAFLIKSMLEFY